MNVLYRRFKNLPIWCVILLSALFVAYVLDISSSTAVIYWLRFLRNQTIYLLCFCSGVLWLLVLPLWVFYQAKDSPNSVPVRSILQLALFTVVALLIFGAALFSEESYRHRASERMQDHLYYLSSFQAIPFMGMGSYLNFDLYECDSVGFICHPIFKKAYLMSSYEMLINNTHLVVDPATNTLALEINGEVVYTHQP